MNVTVPRLVGLALTITIAALYAVLAHISNAVPGNQGLGLLLSVGPIWLIAVTIAWRSEARWPGLAACLAIAVGLFLYRLWLEQHFPWIYLLQQVGIYALLGMMFGRTLLGTRVPLCTQLALVVHGTLPPEALEYSRKVTLAWTIFFAAIVSALLLTFFVAPLTAWSALANFGVAPLIAAMFLVEHWIRRRALPALAHTSLRRTVQAFTDYQSREAR